MLIGRRIYYDVNIGEVLIDTGERQKGSIPTTVEQDIATYTRLSERNRDTFDFIELEFGQYSQDFAESNGFRVNPETRTLEFSYPDPNEPEAPSVFGKPLTEQIKDVENQANATSVDLQAFMDYYFENGGV